MDRTKYTTPALAAVALASAVTVHAADAGLLVHEGFDYPALAPLAGNAGGTWDASRAWQTGGNSNGSIDSATVVAGLSLGSYPVVGNAAEVLTNNNNGGNYNQFIASRQLPASLSFAASSDVYTSFLYRSVQSGSFANESTLSLGSSPGAGGRFLQTRGVTLFGDNAPDNFAVGADNGVGPSSSAIVAGNTTYLAVSKFTNVNGPTFSSNTATAWLFDAASWEAIVALPRTEAALDANALARVTHTPGNTFVVTATASDYLRLDVVTAFGINNRTVFDELRLATTLDAVLPVVPEPATLGLLAGTGLLALRRRQ